MSTARGPYCTVCAATIPPVAFVFRGAFCNECASTSWFSVIALTWTAFGGVFGAWVTWSVLRSAAARKALALPLIAGSPLLLLAIIVGHLLILRHIRGGTSEV